MASKRSRRTPQGASLPNAMRPGELLIDDSTPNDVLFVPVIDGQPKAHGLVPRKHSIHPAEMFAPPSDIGLIPRTDWSTRCKENVETKSAISDVLLDAGVECLDQANEGYCWGYSTGGCVMAVRALNNQPYRRLNPHSVCAVIKNGRNEGGWCGLSAKFLREYGICDETVWPRHSRQVSNWTDAAKANAKRNLVTEDFVDLTRSIYDQNLTFDQLATCLLSRIPCAVDFNHWSHSVMATDLVEVEPGSWGIRIRNSWTDKWGDRGFAVMRGQKAIPDGALAIRVVSASIARVNRRRGHHPLAV